MITNDETRCTTCKQLWDECFCEDYESEDNWQPCNDCDRPDACEDFGCAIEAGIKRKPDNIF